MKPSAIAAGLKSPKTTAGAILAFLSFALLQAQAQWDGDPETVAQWALLIPAALAVGAFFFARDANKTSAESGAE